MEAVLTPFLVLLALYVIGVLAVGTLAGRRAGRSGEEYFLAGRGLGSAVLFMALFGTNCTAFVLVGIPGRAYRDGIGVFGLNAPIVALGIPLSFWAIGSPARRMAARLGALTPAELYARRLGSRAVGVTLFAFFTLYTLPYMVTAVQGAAGALERVAAVPPLVGGVGVLVVALAYTSLGGMRATAWTNVLQGALFMGFMVVAFVGVSRSMGGLAPAIERVRASDPGLLVRGDQGLYEPRAFASWSLAISLTVIAFPHMLVRLIAARDDRTLKRICRLYPPALVALWLPAVMLGVWGAAEFPGLDRVQSDGIFALMILKHLPPWVAAWGFLAVLAAVMSTLDAQLLTLGSMLTRDVLRPAPGGDGGPGGGRDVGRGRLFGLVVALGVGVLWRATGDTIFGVASIAFSGYVTLAPLLFLGVRWRRFNAAGALASMVVGNGVYFLALGLAASRGDGIPLAGAALSPAWGGFLPVTWGLVAAAAAGVGVSLATGAPDPERTAAAFGGHR